MLFARENVFHLCTIGRQIAYNAGRASTDVIKYRRRPAPVQAYYNVVHGATFEIPEYILASERSTFQMILKKMFVFF